MPEIKIVPGRPATTVSGLNSATSINNQISENSTPVYTVNMSSRAGLRFFESASFSRAFTKKSLGRRYQTANATTAAPTEGLVQRLWNSPVGVKTVHFW